MSGTNTQELITEFTENYVENIFYFCLKKTGNHTEAEDLAQDISLNILTALNKGTIPENFPAWVWRIARNRYCAWADVKHRKTESVAGGDIGDYELEDTRESTLDNMIHNEQLTLLRRELAFIESEYRNLLAAYYIENKSVREIATSLSLSTDAVKQRLYRARNKLKEGMNMAKEFGIRSYRPEDIYYSIALSCHGDRMQPNSIMEHPLYVNIFLEAYGNPSSAESLSLELGIALPYMETELEYLTRETFLKKEKGKYQTAFPIISGPAREQVHHAKQAAAPDITKALTSFLAQLHESLSQTEYDYFGSFCDFDSAKWTLLMRAHQYFECKLIQPHSYTKRPDNGSWDIVGYQHCCLQTPPFFVGNYVHGGEGYFFQQFKYEFRKLPEYSSPMLTDAEVKILYQSLTGCLEPKDMETAQKLAENGYLRLFRDTYVPAIPILNVKKINDAIKVLDSETLSRLTALANAAKEQMKTLYESIAEIIRRDLPPMLSENEHIYQHALSGCLSLREYILEEALRHGYLPPVDNVAPSIGAHMDLL